MFSSSLDQNNRPSLPNMTGDLSGVATRIQDRNRQLAQEQHALVAAKEELKENQAILQSEMRNAFNLRRKMLSVQRNRHGFELEFMKAKEQQEEHQESIRRLEREKGSIQEEMRILQSNWEGRVDKIFAVHQNEMKLYEMYLEFKIRDIEQASVRRQEQLKFLQQEEQKLVDGRKWALEQQSQMQWEMERMAEKEGGENDQVQQLALQVRSALGKRAELRAALREAQKNYQMKNDEMLKWERELTSHE